MTDITLTDMEDLQTKIDDFVGDTYPSYSDQLSLYTGAISGTSSFHRR